MPELLFWYAALHGADAFSDTEPESRGVCSTLSP